MSQSSSLNPQKLCTTQLHLVLVWSVFSSLVHVLQQPVFGSFFSNKMWFSKTRITQGNLKRARIQPITFLQEDFFTHWGESRMLYKVILNRYTYQLLHHVSEIKSIIFTILISAYPLLHIQVIVATISFILRSCQYILGSCHFNCHENLSSYEDYRYFVFRIRSCSLKQLCKH